MECHKHYAKRSIDLKCDVDYQLYQPVHENQGSDNWKLYKQYSNTPFLARVPGSGVNPWGPQPRRSRG